MSHQVLARKWRPRSFQQLVGQQHVVQALSNALDSGRLHHAYLLTGTRGVGKTTIGRILARCFNCEQGVSSNPCGECSICREIFDGRSIDLIEVDAASRTKVDEMRELLDNVQYLPTQARYKIYLIDEVHMLTNNSFNALLKTLEEPPPHVIFILATTHPQKIPATVLSRCLQFHLKNMPAQLIVEHLQSLLAEEGIAAERGGLELIAQAAAGSMRDALSITDQAIAHGSDTITQQNVHEMLGVIDQQILLDLLNALADDNAQQLLDLLSRFLEYASDLTVLIDELLKLLHRIVVEQVLPGAGSEGYALADDIKRYATLFSPEEVQIYYQTALQGKRDMPLAPDPLTGMEMIALRLLAFRQLRDETLQSVDSNTLAQGAAGTNATVPSVDAPSDNASAQVGGERGAADSTKKYQAPANAALRQHRNDVDARGAEGSSQAAESAYHAAEGSYHAAEGSADRAVQKQSAASQLQNVAADREQNGVAKGDAAALDNGDQDATPSIDSFDNNGWCRIFSALPLTGLVRSVVSHCILQSVQSDTDTLVFLLPEHDATLYKESFAQRLAKGLSIYFGKPVAANITVVESAACESLIAGRESPDQYRSRLQQEKLDSTIKTLESDENVQQLIDAFDATLLVDSVKVLDDQ